MGLSQQQKIRHREQEDSKKGVIEPFYEEETIKANNDDTSTGIQAPLAWAEFKIKIE